MKAIGYTIVMDENYLQLSIDIHRCQLKDWVCQGGLQISPEGTYYQAMVYKPSLWKRILRSII